MMTLGNASISNSNRIAIKVLERLHAIKMKYEGNGRKCRKMKNKKKSIKSKQSEVVIKQTFCFTFTFDTDITLVRFYFKGFEEGSLWLNLCKKYLSYYENICK